MAAKTKRLIEEKNIAKLGQQVLVYPEPGADPFLATVNQIDLVSGIILTVVIKDKNKLEMVIDVKNTIVTFVPFLWSFIQKVKSWFKKK